MEDDELTISIKIPPFNSFEQNANIVLKNIFGDTTNADVIGLASVVRNFYTEMWELVEPAFRRVGLSAERIDVVRLLILLQAWNEVCSKIAGAFSVVIEFTEDSQHVH
jgi:hypothetical protein